MDIKIQQAMVSRVESQPTTKNQKEFITDPATLRNPKEKKVTLESWNLEYLIIIFMLVYNNTYQS